MGSIADYFAIIVIIYSFWKGWEKNVSDLLSGPISFMVAILGGFWFYILQKNTLYAFIAGTAAFFLFQLAINFSERLIASRKKTDVIESPGPLAFFLSGLLNSVWGFFIFALFLTGLILWPTKNHYLQEAQKDVQFSQLYSLLQQMTNDQLPDHSISETTIKEWTKPINVEEWSRIEKIAPSSGK